MNVFVDDESYHHGHGHAYESYGINEDEGRLVVVRPDQRESTEFLINPFSDNVQTLL